MARYKDLPTELIFHIATALDSWRDLASLAATNQHMRGVVGSFIVRNLMKMNLGFVYLTWSIDNDRISAVRTALHIGVDPNERLESSIRPGNIGHPNLTYRRSGGITATAIPSVYDEISQPSPSSTTDFDANDLSLNLPRTLWEHGCNHLTENVSALHLAAQRGNAEIIELLIGHGANLEALCFGGHGGTVMSARYIFSDRYHQSSDPRDDKIRPQFRHTPLHCAILSSNLPAAKLLLSAQASHKICVGVDTRRSSAWLVPSTPLHLAAFTGSRDLVEYIVENGYQTNVNTADEFGGTALAYASMSASLSSVGPYLLGKGGNPDTLISEDCNLLLEACWHGRFRDALLLLNHGAQIRGPASLFSTPLHACCRRVNSSRRISPYYSGQTSPQELLSEELRLEVVRKLISMGADLDKCVLYADLGRATALMLAADSGLALVVKELLSAGFNLSAHNTAGFNALEAALRSTCDEQPKFDTVRCLLNHDYDTSGPDTSGVSSLHLLALAKTMNQRVFSSRYEEALTRQLLERGADIHARSTTGISVFQSFCRLGSYRTLRLLAEYGATDSVTPDEILDMFKSLVSSCVTAPDTSERLPIVELLLTVDHMDTILNDAEVFNFAMSHSEKKTAKLLLKKGCAISSTKTGIARGNYLHNACLFGAVGIVELLLDRGEDVNQRFDSSVDTTWNGRTPIQCAIMYANRGHFSTPTRTAKAAKLLELLLDRGALVQDPALFHSFVESIIQCNGAHLLSVIFKFNPTNASYTDDYNRFLELACDSSQRPCHPDVIRALLQQRSYSIGSHMGPANEPRLHCGKDLVEKLVANYLPLEFCPYEDCDCGDNLMKCLVVLLSEGRLSTEQTYSTEANEVLNDHRPLLKKAVRDATLKMGSYIVGTSPGGRGRSSRHCLEFIMDRLRLTSADLRSVPTNSTYFNTII